MELASVASEPPRPATEDGGGGGVDYTRLAGYIDVVPPAYEDGEDGDADDPSTW